MDTREGPLNPRVVLFNVSLGMFMTALNHRAIFVSLPTLTRVFQTSVSTIQWALLVYDLTLIGLVLTLGRMGDLYGRKRIYTSGFLVFGLGSALCGFSRSPAELIVFRVVQAVGGAMLTANGRALVTVAFPAAERGKALGLTQMAFHVGFLTGPTLGGFLIDSAGWQWIFFLNVPVAVAGAYLARRTLPESLADRQSARLDFLGAALLLAANTAFLYALNQAPHLGFRHPRVISLIVVSAVTLCLFIVTELRVGAPVLSLSLFRNRLFSTANLSLFCITSTQSAINFLMPFYLESIMGFTPSQMGWIIITNSAVIIVVGPLAGWLSDRLGSRSLCTLGSALIVLAQFFIASLTFDASVIRIILPLALSGLGWAIFNAPNQSAIFGSVPRDKLGVASGVSTTTARVGGAAGVALSAALFTYGLAAAGLSPLQIESPQYWSSAPRIFMGSFRYTVHIINLFTMLSVLFSAARGGRRS
ncbi:MAG: MFS transporter [Deltaproteobacteria bacterium]|nr:MFS transporter [Deltaproteobacteria bacterium]